MKDTNQEQVILMKVDYAFKYVMRNKNVMKGFLSAVLGVDKKEILEIEYLDTNTEKDGEASKLGIMDLLVSMNGSKRINIEIQLYYVEGWLNRSLFYLCEEYTTGFRSGKGYAEIPSVVSINILDFIILKDEEWVYNTYKMTNQQSHNVLTDKIDIHIIELRKLKKVSEEELEQHKEVIKWAKFIAAETWQDYEVFGREDADMAEAVEELRKINADEIERLRYLHREIAMRDEYQRKLDEEKRQAERKEDEARRKEDEARRKEDEARRKEDEAKRREDEARRKEDEARRKEDEAKRKEDENHRKEIQIREEKLKIKEEQIKEKEKRIKEEEKFVKDKVDREKNSMLILLKKITEGTSKAELLKEGYSVEDIERIEGIINKGSRIKGN